MDKKTKILAWFVTVLILGSIGVTYWRVMLKKDYIIEGQVDCDPTIEKCFIYTCDPKTETTCTGNPDDDVWYYQKVRRNASKIPSCDPSDENCQEFACGEGEKDCSVIFCDDKTKEKDDECSDPVQYNIDNPAEEEDGDEEAIECEDGDESCQQSEDADVVECEEGDEECLNSVQETQCDPDGEDCPVDVDLRELEKDATKSSNQSEKTAADSDQSEY